MSNLTPKQDNVSTRQQKRTAHALTRAGEASAKQSRKADSHRSKAAWLTVGAMTLGAAALYHYSLDQKE